MSSSIDLTDIIIPRLSTGLILYLLALLLLANIIQRIRAWYRLRHIPGPPLAGWTSLWLSRRYLAWNGSFCQDVPALVEKYGPVIRIGPDKVVCTDIPTLYRISGVRSEYRKSKWYTISRVSRGADHLLSLIDPEPRRERKKYVMPAYSGKGVDSFEEGTNKALASWLDLIDRKYISAPGKHKTMNLEEKAHFFTLDAIGEIAYSESFECVKQDRDTKSVLAINDATVPILMAVGNYVAFWKMLRMWPFYLILPNDGDQCGFGAIVGHASKLIAERLQSNDNNKRDMLHSFIAHGLRGEALKQEVGIQFFAGSDTVASTLYTTFFLLLTHPPVYSRLQSELDIAYTNGKISSSPHIRDSEARALPYLQAVIREGIRLFPALTAPPLYKEVPPQGDEVCRYALPAGTLVATGNAMWHGSRERGFWGEDGDCFRPERWLNDEGLSEERLGEMKRRVELAFGSGQFVCVGRGIAMVELGKVIAELVRRYNWSLADPLNPPRIQNPGVWVVRNFMVRVEKR